MRDVFSTREWYTIPQAAAELGVSTGRVSTLIEDKQLLSFRIEREPRIPQEFIKDGEPLAGLRGTLFLLGDAGLGAHDQMVWLLSVDETLGVAPLDALVQGRKTQVRHAVQLLAI